MKIIHAAFIIVSIACTFSAGLVISSLVDYFDTIPQPIMTGNWEKWGYYSEYCAQLFTFNFKNTETLELTTSYSWYEYCNI